MSKTKKKLRLTFQLVTPDRWEDFETLFGERGACGGCWCMAWRMKSADWQKNKGAGNRRRMKRLISSGEAPGILAYHDGEPVGWCSVAPREKFTALARSRVLKPVDEKPVWSVSCFFVRKDLRGRGVSVRLLEAAARFAADNGAKIVEGYPYDPGKTLPAPFVWTGLVGTFRKAGFREVARRSRTRPVMRRSVRPRRSR
jgi:GNAT superfamily N-acetyltransferase